MRYTIVLMLCVSLWFYAFGNNVVQQEIDRSKRWALIIGISQYEREDDINPLRFADRDATAVRDALIDPRTGTFLADHVLVLSDSALRKPTKSNILESLAILKNKTKPEDTLLIFFSGHGYQKGEGIYLLPQDSKFVILEDTTIPLTLWKERIASIPAQQKIVILDACHSGGVEKTKKGGIGEMTSEFEQAIAPSVSDFGQAVFSSSMRGQASYEDEDTGHGVFTRYLLETLSGQGDANGDNIITLRETSDYVEQQVRAWGAQHGKVQTPYLESSLTKDLVLALATSTEESPRSIQQMDTFIPLPTAPYDKDEYTIHLWHLDGNVEGIRNAPWTKGKFGLGLHYPLKGGELVYSFSISSHEKLKVIYPEGSVEFWLKLHLVSHQLKPNSNYGGTKLLTIESRFMHYDIGIKDGTLYIQTSGDRKLSRNITLEPNVWYHVAAIWIDNVYRLYVNGKMEAIATAVQTLQERYLNYNYKVYLFRGSFTIDEIRISKIARVGSRILSDTNGWLGVFITEVSEVLAKDVGLPNRDGVLVTEAIKGGPADKAGIVLGDIILAFNGKKVRNLTELMMFVVEIKVGSVVPVTINRDGVEKVILVKIGVRLLTVWK